MIFIRNFLHHAALASPYYRDQDWALQLRAGREVGLDSIPVTKKAAVQENPGRFRATRVPAQAGPSVEKYTSGSTGVPLVVHKSAVHFQINASENFRLRQPWNLEAHKRQIHFKIPGPNSSAGTVTKETLPNGNDVTNVYSRSPEFFIPLINSKIATSFSAITNIVSSVLQDADPACGLELVETYYEAQPDNFGDLLARIPGCRNMDVYGSVETGLIAISCPICGTYHLAEHNSFMEILRPDDTPASEGELGRVVATVFSNPAMPLIRYDLGDIVRFTRQSPCKPGAISLTRIYGRERMMFRLPDGSHVLPALDAEEMLLLGVKRFRLVQVAPHMVELHYTGPHVGFVPDLAKIQDLARKALSPQLEIKLKEVSAFPLAPSGKYLMHERLF